MKRIFKYPLECTDDQIIDIPPVEKFLTVKTQRGIPTLWALVNDDLPPTPQHFITVGTGHPCDHVTAHSYIGTYQLDGGALVFHVFTGPVA